MADAVEPQTLKGLRDRALLLSVGQARLTDQSVALVIKQLALKVGLDPSRYAGHSLRSGFLTSAARNRASIFKITEQDPTDPYVRWTSSDIRVLVRPGARPNTSRSHISDCSARAVLEMLFQARIFLTETGIEERAVGKGLVEHLA